MNITTHGGTTDASDKQQGVVAVGSMPLLDCCPDWSKQLRFYNQPEVLAAIDKDGRFRAEGKHWNYCPWCGKKNPYAEEKQSND
jgi:hypothetical protein